MTKTKTVKKLEAIIDALHDSYSVINHNATETDYVNDLIIKYQYEYRSIVGRFYTPRHKRKV